MPRPPRPGHDIPEELPEVSSGDHIRLLGGGESEDLEDPGVHMVPRARWLGPAFLVVVLTGLVGLLVVTLLPWIRPVHLAHDRVHDLYQPPLSVDGRHWAEPGELEPDTFLIRFCGGLLLRAVDPAESVVMSTGRGERPGNALTAVYAEAESADAAYTQLAGGLGNCTQRGARWEMLEPDNAIEQTLAFRLEPPRQSRGNRHHLLLVQYANTVTLFMTPTAPDAEATRSAYAGRVASVARAAAQE